jgi:hypothetical protein
LASSEKQAAKVHVAPCSRAEEWSNRHIGAGSQARGGVELRELEHFHYRIARLMRARFGIARLPQSYGHSGSVSRPSRLTAIVMSVARLDN